ncbi:hypothetical protein IB276_22570 [Ensifer sp. ENS04]|uniref:hypothetical protein n=1 Tax=Ensifer sp. ENS04 TaxID=2769281 RepID=UPI00178345D3|nr:hypothetical protein [Ensifer sp. ENS04]MBD9542233.1 hypothetical protein [Ensifer sp. ENS04]
MNTTANARILIHTAGQEGAFFIEALSGQVILDGPTDELPEWAAEGLVNANPQERRTFYVSRIGEKAFTDMGTPEALEYKDLGWVAADHEGDLVEIDADHQWRLENLATLLEVDTSVEGFDKGIEGATVEAMVSETYRTSPTDEETLAEVEGVSFSDVERQRSHG